MEIEVNPPVATIELDLANESSPQKGLRTTRSNGNLLMNEELTKKELEENIK